MLGSSILTRKKGPTPLPQVTTRQLGLQAVSSSVTERTAYAVSPYRRGVRLISRTIGMLPFALVRNGVVTTEQLPLLERPVPWMSRQAAVESMVQTLIDYGNYVALWAQFDALGRPQGIVPVHPRDCSVALTESGLVWRIGTEVYGSLDVLHIRTGGPPDSLLGWGVLQTSGPTLRTATSVTSATEYFYADGVYPAGALKVEDPDITQDEADALGDRWVSKVRRNRPAVLPAGIEWVPVVAPNAEQAQLAQAVAMSRQAVADLLDLDGDWLGVPNASMTYANIVDRADHLVRFTCQPWMTGIEDGLTDSTSRPTVVKFLTKDLLRGQTADRYATYEVALRNKFMTVDEVREEEGREPLPPEPEPTPPALPPGPPGLPPAPDPDQPQEGQP